MKLSYSMAFLTLAATLGFSSACLSQTRTSRPAPQQQMELPRKSTVQSGFSAAVYYNTVNQLKADRDVESDNGLETVRLKNLTYEIEQAPGVLFSYQQKPDEGFGFMLGGFFENERKVKSASGDYESIFLGRSSFKGDTDMKIQQWGLEGSLIYSAGPVYFPFGAHIPFVSIKGGNSDVSNQSGFGFQGGIGFQPASWFAAEAALRSTAVSVKIGDAKESTALAGAGATFLAKFLF